MKRRTWLGMGMAILMLALVGCSGGSEADQAKALAEKAQSQTDEDTQDTDVEALKEENRIPEDGIITAAQLETIAGEDMTVNFTGEGEDISYTWAFPAKQIQNPVDQNLLITPTEEDVDEVKKMANNATAGIGLTFYNSEGQICLPQLTITLDEKLDADTLIFCTVQDNQVKKICDVDIDNSGEASVLTFSPSKTDGVCYIVGGKASGDAEEAADTEDAVSEEEKNEEEENTSVGQLQAEGETQAAEAPGNTQAQQNDAAENTCTISIVCETILNNMDKLTDGKEEFVPSNGVILAPSEIEFTPGESVHDVLTRACQTAGIQMESSFTPAYNAAYLEGINQLYEFDCGEQSGWMYQVNGWYPNYSCSSYEVQSGDVIVWQYTCDLGRDIGGYMSGQ